MLASEITRDLGLSNTEFGGIVTWFLLAYTISQSLSGKLYDRIGTRLGFTVSIIVWSPTDEVARVIAFLASDASKFVAGETIEINGGMLML